MGPQKMINDTSPRQPTTPLGVISSLEITITDILNEFVLLILPILQLRLSFQSLYRNEIEEVMV